MMNGIKKEIIKNDVFNKYLEIKQDIINNLKTVFNKQHTYIRKYRGNAFTDINIGFYQLDYDNHAIQIYIRHSDVWIKDIMVFNSKNKYIHSNIKTTLRNYE